MKKVLIAVPTFSNLSETFILREVESLNKSKDLDINVVSLKKGKATVSDELNPKVIYIKIKPKDVLSSLGFFLKNFKSVLKTGNSYFSCSDQPFFYKIYIFLKGIVCAYKLKEFSFSHIHIHFMSEFSSIFGVSCMILNKKFSISGHAKDIYLDITDPLFKAKYSKFISVCNTKAFLKLIELSGGKGRKNIVLAFHGINPELFEFKKRKMSFNKKINVLCDARFTEKKGLEYLSQAVISLIKDYNFDLELTLVGLAVTESQKIYLEQIKKLFKDSEIYNRLHIPNNGDGLQQKDVVKEYDSADVFIYSGINADDGDVDGIPNSLLQAAFNGLPIITTQAGSISDLFNEKNSYIINQRDVLDIIDKFNEMVIDKNLTKKIELMHKNVVESFDEEKNTKYLEKLIVS